MQRRALLAGVVGGTAALAGCNAATTDDTTRDVYNPTGRATTRPLDEPLVRHGLTSDAGQYVHARLFQPGDALPVTDDPDAAWLSEGVEALSDGQFAVSTLLRTAAAAPAYLWPRDTEWTDGTLQIQLQRQAMSTDADADEVVGVALVTFEHDGEPPDGADLILPGGATFSVGSRR